MGGGAALPRPPIVAEPSPPRGSAAPPPLREGNGARSAKAAEGRDRGRWRSRRGEATPWSVPRSLKKGGAVGRTELKNRDACARFGRELDHVRPPPFFSSEGNRRDGPSITCRPGSLPPFDSSA